MSRIRTAGLALALAAGAIAADTINAQPWPSKPLRLVLPFPPGGPTDLLGRALAQKLGEQLGQQVLPDNRPGAGGNLGLELTAKAAPDGYTLVLSSPLIAISPSLYAKLNYDPKADLAPVSLVAQVQNVVIVHPSVPARSLKQLVQIARSSPGKLNFGSGGVGTTSHLAPELFKSVAKLDMVHVPYKGTGLALTAMLGGEIDMLVMAIPASYSQVLAGRVRGLAVLSEKRSGTLPDVPTAREGGMDNIDVALWYGILVPAGTPGAVIGRLNAEFAKALAAPDLKERFASAGIEPIQNSPAEFAAFIASEGVRFARVIKEARIPAQ